MRPQICLFMSLLGWLRIEANTRYSDKCQKHLTSYWNKTLRRCEPCETWIPKIAGKEFAPNCGRQDDGGQPARAYVPCKEGTFNNGSFVACRKCTSCQPSQQILASCSTTMDTQCCKKEMMIHGKCRGPETMESTTQPISSVTTREPSALNYHYLWIAAALFLFLVCPLLLIFNHKKSKCCRKVHPREVKNKLLLLPLKDKKVDELLALHIREAPLQTVLDNLDVLEELIMLLDPESSVAKTTRHVATQCSFSATWINYAYSMRDSKSPLRAVLESVTTKFPEWTVGHLARVFHDIGRNDAVAALAKLPVSVPAHQL